jgi:diguanylate cyclase (GGDEF)-like protein
MRRWCGAARSWTRQLVTRLPGVPVGFEQLLHPLIAALETAVDRSAVEASLLATARKLAPTARIELVSATAQADVEGSCGEEAAPLWRRRGGRSTVDIPLRCGAVVHGRLRVSSEASGRSALTATTSRRLLTICTLAAAALENVRQPAEWHWEADAPNPADADQAGHGPHIAKEFISTPMLRDATFLNAVLPFALAQAERHREPLSLLCLSIDRLGAIQKLLGVAAVDPLVRHVGDSVAALLRASDIVARLDDDRIVAILPRATSDDALFVAERICSDVVQKNHDAVVMPGVTVSIGVATFPTCAGNVSSLFNAADEALAQAIGQGRGQCVLASPRPAPEPTSHDRCRISNA